MTNTSPPLFSDLGKSARDVIFKGYNYGITKIQVKSKFGETELNTSVLNIHDTTTSRGNVEHKYKWPKYGFTLINKWNSENNFTVNFSIENSIINRLKSTFEAQISPVTGKKTGAIRNDFKHSRLRANIDVNVDFAGPIVKNGFVFRHGNWFAGVCGSFDLTKYQIHSKSFSLQYSEPDITLFTSLENQSNFSGSFLHKVNEKTDIAAILNWSPICDDTKMTFGFKHLLDDKQILRGKVNNSKQISLSYQIELLKGIYVTLSMHLEGKNLQSGGHKVGFGIETNI